MLRRGSRSGRKEPDSTQRTSAHRAWGHAERRTTSDRHAADHNATLVATRGVVHLVSVTIRSAWFLTAFLVLGCPSDPDVDADTEVPDADLPDTGDDASTDSGDADPDTSPPDAGPSDEPNETPETATPLDALADEIAHDGTIEVGDVDWYALELSAGQMIQARADYGLDEGILRVELFAPDGEWRAERARWNDQGTFTARAPVTETGIWFLRVSARADDGPVSYRLRVNIDAALGDVHFVAPDGDDDASGEEGAPWQSFRKALGALEAGDMLVLAPGTWTNDDACREGDPAPCATGVVPMGSAIAGAFCGEGQRACDGEPCDSGTVEAPIQVVASRERQSLLAANGQTGFAVIDCEGWILQGLRVRSADNPESTAGTGIALSRSTNVTVRRALSRFPNRYANAHGISAASCTGARIEESEAYAFRRHGIMCFQGDGCSIDASYVNSRDTITPEDCGDFEGTFCTDSGTRLAGDEGVSLYLADTSILENNISEGNSGIQVSGVDGLVLGNMLIDQVGNGFQPATHPRSYGRISSGTVMNNNVVLRPNDYGVIMRSAPNALIRHLSVFDSPRSGVQVDNHFSCGRTESPCTRPEGHREVVPSFRMLDTLIVSPGGRGLAVGHREDFSSIEVDTLHLFNDEDRGVSGVLEGDVLGVTRGDPELGGCYVYIPEDGATRGVGRDGSDIGANVIFRYRQGSLTRERMWDMQTGEYPCGVVVPGVNDIAGDSCFDVHERLHVGTDGCAVPTGIGR